MSHVGGIAQFDGPLGGIAFANHERLDLGGVPLGVAGKLLDLGEDAPGEPLEVDPLGGPQFCELFIERLGFKPPACIPQSVGAGLFLLLRHDHLPKTCGEHRKPRHSSQPTPHDLLLSHANPNGGPISHEIDTLNDVSEFSCI